ncbi:multidrug transporter AcrB [Candidatus Omnitrophus magneticus]|uniref:Multidrug transporter AcrB n=1 Tax=Candidatus Omnitrophus magneticus TaxID=1609969 RepID=A0A0F0CWN2_9BACT|nr:multidrug transporter AcrB [Candidatus Omnitrophus magneticus]
MGLPNFSVKKPVTTIMIFVGVLLFGAISLMKLPQELFPPIKYPQLTVFTLYANAAPEEIETLITKPIEEAVGTVSGLRSVRSVSREGVSLVFAEFSWEQNMDFASLWLREKIDLVKARLPRDCSEPLVVPFDPFEMPVMRISVTGERSPVALRKIAVDIIKEELEKIDGVASASVEGGLEREILVKVNQNKLEAYDVPILDVSDAIKDSNLNYPAGTIKESFYEYLIRTLGEFESFEEIQDVTVKVNSHDTSNEDNLPFDDKLKARNISASRTIISVKDVAEVVDTYKERSSYSRYNSQENITISLQKQAQVNTIQLISNVKTALPIIQKRLPQDVQMKVIYDQSKFIRSAINGVKDAAWQGGIITFLVLLFFLRDFKASFIVNLTIPISIIVVFTFMYFGGLSINMMSLGGLALGVGMLVDGAIVVIENIFRHRELGESQEEAAIKGTEEVSGAVIASVLTTIVVFLPMIFVIGVTGQLFKQLSFTITFSLLASLWVAFTLIPLLSCKLGSGQKTTKSNPSFTGGHIWIKLLDKHESLIKFFLHSRWKGLGIVSIIFVISIFLLLSIERELMPKTDEGEFIIKADLPVGTRVDETNRLALIIEESLREEPVIENISTVVGSTAGTSAKDVIKSMGAHQTQMIVTLQPKRKEKTVDVVRMFEEKFKNEKYNPAKIEIVMAQTTMAGAFGSSGKPIAIEVKGDNLDVMEDLARKTADNLKKIKGVSSVETDIPERSPEIRINIDKDKASLYNISVVDLARVAQMILRGYISSEFKEKGKEIDIRVVLREEDRDKYDKLYYLRINSPARGMIPLGSLVTFNKGMGPSEVRRVSQERTIAVTANIAGRKNSEVMADIDNMLNNIKIPQGYRVKLTGESEEMKKSFNSLQFALILSIVLVYMIMAAEFESITQPIIILITLPLSLIGVALALFISHTSLNIISLLGVIILGGIVVDNGIVLIDYINLLLSRGKEIKEAVIEASRARLRPILMTALTTALGLIPMAFSVGEGAELQRPMAISVMGGLLVATVLTLFVLPSIFLLEHEFRNKLKKKFTKELREGTVAK